jgi:phage/plasmid-associated DNA primase
MAKKKPEQRTEAVRQEQVLKAKKRCVMGLWAQSIEQRLQETSIKWLVDNKGTPLEHVIPCQDGFMIWPDAYYPGIEEDLQRANEDAWKLTVKWARKPFDEATSGIPEVDMEVVRAERKRHARLLDEHSAASHTDKNMADHFVALYGNSFRAVGRSWYYYNQILKLWREDDGSGVMDCLTSQLLDQYSKKALKLTKDADELEPEMAEEQKNADELSEQRRDEIVAAHTTKEKNRKRAHDADWKKEYDEHEDVVDWKRRCVLAVEAGAREPKAPVIKGPKFQSDPIPRMSSKTPTTEDAKKVNDRINDLRRMAKNFQRRTDDLGTSFKVDAYIKLIRANKTIRQADKLQDTDKVENTFNKKVGFLPIRGGKMFNMDTLEVTERGPTDHWSIECRVDYISELTEGDIAFALGYFMAMMRHDEELVQLQLDMVKSSLYGRVLAALFFCIGESGSNGKSFFVELLQKSYPGFVQMLAKEAIVETTSSSSKQDNIAPLVVARIAIVSELTGEEKMNQPLVKRHSGGENHSWRPVFGAQRESPGTANIICMTNYMMKFEDNQSMMRRLITIPYKAKFKSDPAFRPKMLAQRSLDVLFSYTMQHGVAREEFDINTLPRAAKMELDVHRDANMEKDVWGAIYKFWRQFVHVDSGSRISTTTLHDALKLWLDEVKQDIPDSRGGAVVKHWKRKFSSEYKFTIENSRVFVGISCSYQRQVKKPLAEKSPEDVYAAKIARMQSAAMAEEVDSDDDEQPI